MRALIKCGLAQQKSIINRYNWIAMGKSLPRLYTTNNEAILKVVQPHKLHLLDQGPETEMKFTAAESLKTYKNMVSMRKLETTIANMYRAKKIRGFCHVYIGQEAIAAGIVQEMRQQDVATTGYRCHGWCYILGTSMVQVMAELLGRKAGICRGKGGSMHLYNKQLYGGHGIVGAQGPIGVGVSFAQKYLSSGGVSFSAFGDGGSNQGQIYEVMNMACLWHLPSVFLLEDNRYGMGTSVKRHSGAVEFYRRINFLPGLWVDGMDVVATRAAAKFCIDYCSSGKGPLSLHMDTYRYTGHSMSDPGTSYRNRKEIDEVRKKRDPIELFKTRILEASLVTEDQLKEIRKSVKNEVDRAAAESLKSPKIGIQEVAADVYAKNLETTIRSTVPDKPLKHIAVPDHHRIHSS